MAKAVTKKAYHTITVRLQPADHEYLKSVQQKDQEEQQRNVPYTEILIRALRASRVEVPRRRAVAR